MLCNEGSDIEALGYMFENGIGIEGTLTVDVDTLMVYYAEGIRRIVLVFDLDSDNKKKSQFIPVDKIRAKISEVELALRVSGLDIVVEYLPVVYAAETILLYQYLSELKHIPEICVNIEDTLILQTSMLRVLNGLSNERAVKRCPEYVDTSVVLQNIRKAWCTFNTHLFRVLQNPEIVGLDKAGALCVCEDAHKLFESCTGFGVDFDIRGVHFNSKMSVPEMREQVSKYLVEIGVKKQRR